MGQFLGGGRVFSVLYAHSRGKREVLNIKKSIKDYGGGVRDIFEETFG